MAISYKKLMNYLDRKGMSVNYLYSQRVITDAAAQNLRKGKPVSLKHIDAICQFLGVPIEQVVEIISDK